MPLVASVELPGNATVRSDEADAQLLAFLHQVGVLGPVILNLSEDINSSTKPSSLDTIKALLYASSTLCPYYLEGLALDNDEIATLLLDSGLSVVFFNSCTADNIQEKELLIRVLKSFPKERVGLTFRTQPQTLHDSQTSSHPPPPPSSPSSASSSSTLPLSIEEINNVIEEYGDVCGHFIFNWPGAAMDVASAKELYKKLSGKGSHLYFAEQRDTDSMQSQFLSVANVCERVHAVFEPKIKNTSAGVEQGQPQVFRNPYKSSDISISNEIDYVSAYMSYCLQTDRTDGLYTTVVCDNHDVCLGLVYSNEESLRTAVCCGRGVYWSRSRSSLWRKGDTSGMHQDLIAIRCDCDGDALRFTVVQNGDPPAFCHLMTRTCWGQNRGIHKLEAMLVDRKKSAPQGSYTARLFADPSLLQKKLLEEVQELVEAQEPDHIAAEAADVLYFMMTRCVAGGVGLREIEQHLDKRSLKITRRPGLAKDWRTEQAQKLLGGQGEGASK